MIAVARWPIMVFDLPFRNEENSGDPWKKCFKYYWESYNGVRFEWSCIRVEMLIKSLVIRLYHKRFFYKNFFRTQNSIFDTYSLEKWKRIESWKHCPIFSSFMDAIDSKNLLHFSMDTFSWQNSFAIVILVFKCVVAFESSAKFSFVLTQATQTHNSNAQPT